MVVLLLLVTVAPSPSAPASINGKGWTALIVGGAIVLYDFGYRLPVDIARSNGARKEAKATITASTYDSVEVSQLSYTPKEKQVSALGGAASVTATVATPA